jgi:hypothetical protein
LAPRVTRFIGAIFAIIAVSDLLNVAYETLMNVTSRAPDLMDKKIEE